MTPVLVHLPYIRTDIRWFVVYHNIYSLVAFDSLAPSYTIIYERRLFEYLYQKMRNLCLRLYGRLLGIQNSKRPDNLVANHTLGHMLSLHPQRV